MKTRLLSVFLALLLLGCRSKADWADVFLRKGEFYFKKGRYEQSIEEYLKAQKLAPSNERIYRDLADVYIAMQRFDAAIEAINSIFTLNPNAGAELYRLRGYAIAQNPKRLEEAIMAGYKPAIEKDSTNASYYQERGLLYQKLNRQTEADQDFAAAKRFGDQT